MGVKIKVPADVCSVSCNGKMYLPSKSGIIEVPAEGAANLVKSHKCTPVEDNKAVADLLEGSKQ